MGEGGGDSWLRVLGALKLQKKNKIAEEKGEIMEKTSGGSESKGEDHDNEHKKESLVDEHATIVQL